MKKQVLVNGQNTSVQFEDVRIDETYKEKKISGGYETSCIYNFMINGEAYPVEGICQVLRSNGGRPNLHYVYKGVKFKNNHKQIIEFILANK